ncbi:protein kinase [Angomonas deanei]|nr:protein kinase [Angomonas deanei]|eukprot:EPY36979.1 protein kinase [Angomonas deanei]
MLTLPHPILASEDDEEYVIRTILGLPDIIEDFFETMEAHFIEGQDCRGKANLLFFRIQRELEILNNVRDGCFWSYNTETGVASRNEEIPKMIVRLSRLFLEDVVTVNPAALSWKKPCVQLAHECSDHLQGGRIQFPWFIKLRRRLVTFNSNAFIFTVILFALIVLFNAVLVVVLPATRPKIGVGVPLGAVAAALLLASSIVVLLHFVFASRALYNLYNRILQENVALSLSANNAYPGDNKISSNPNGALFGGGGRAKITKGRNTKKGFYTIPYLGGIGYIDGRQLDSQVVMIAFDENFSIVRWNSAAEVMTGFLEDGCVGKPIKELVTSPSGGDICEELKQARKSDLVKIKLKALAMAPTTLYTVVAPIVNSEGTKVGSILICANAKDNLRDYRTYIHNYQIYEIKDSLREILERGTLPPEESSIISSLETFSANCVAHRVEELAHEMVSDWEWTNRERLLGRALGAGASAHEVVVDPIFPQTLCLNPLVPNALGLVVSITGIHSSVRLTINDFINGFFYLSITVKLDGSEEKWDRKKLEEAINPLLRSTAGNTLVRDDSIVLHFPCQVAPILEDLSEDGPSGSEQAQQLTQARAIINCSVNVVTAITNIVDQHNISLLLLKTLFVSLAGIRDKSDLEQRLQSKSVDVVVCDRDWLRDCNDLLMSDHGAIVIPIIGAKEVPPQGFNYVFTLPLVGRDVQETMVEVGTVVSKKKNALTAREERERILTLRQDSPWTKGKLLGRGSYGAVYEATSDLTGGKMAVKMFYFVGDSEDSIDKLLNEIQIMCSLNHPNIVHYFHCERVDHNLNLFMELCMCSLTDLINDRRLKPPQLTVVNIIKQVLTAIAYLHSRGTAHRDVKPQNILLKNKEGLIKLTDFGTARQGAATKEVKGTFRYMAPEVYKGLPHGLPCDIWSIGCLVCELFNCPPKFMEVSSILGDMTTITPYLESLPNNPILCDFVYKCFKLDPNLRPTASHLLTHPMLTNTISTDIELLPTIFDEGTRSTDKKTHRYSP